MPNLKTLRTRIKSVKSTSKITKAMQLVSATKFTKIKHELGQAEHYINAISNIASNTAGQNVMEDLPAELHKYFIPKTNSVLLVVFTSEKGLCGSFNNAVIKSVKNDIGILSKDQKDVKLIIIGNKGYSALKANYSNLIVAHYSFTNKNDALFILIKNKIIEMLDNQIIGECYFYFNKFKNAMLQFFTKSQILPIELAKHNKTISAEYEYEYEGENVLSTILDLYINSRINYALLETRAGEEGARMTAMDNATRNANDLVDKLTLQLNRTRQSGITKDLIEIIAGAESV